MDSSVRTRRNTWREKYGYWDKTEQFVEDMFAIEIKGSINIDCKITQDGFRADWLREIVRKKFPLLRGRSLLFEVVSIDVDPPYQIFWKVRNCGEEAYRKKQIRGEIVLSADTIRASSQPSIT